MKFHYHLLINRASGSGNGQKASDKLAALLDKNHLLYTQHFTEYSGHETALIEQLAVDTLIPWDKQLSETLDVFPLLIVVGGDGTLHQVVNQLKALHLDIPLSYIPAGSGNDFARGVGLPREIEKAFWQIFKVQQPRRVNILAYDEHTTGEKGFSVNNVGIGLDAHIVDHTNQSASKKNLNKYNLGSLAYIVSIFQILFKQKGFPILVECNGKTYNYKKAFLCTTTNHPYFGGGVAIAPMASIEEPTLDFVLVERIALFKIFWLILLLTQKKHVHSKYFHRLSATKLHIVSPTPQFMQTDGESHGKNPYDVSFSIDTQLFWL